MKRASYREAIKWIAYNEDTSGIFEKKENGGPFTTTTMCLVADIFDTTTDRVIRDVARESTKLS